MSAKDKLANPLIALVVFLVLTIIALLATIIIMKLNEKPVEPPRVAPIAQKLVAPEKKSRPEPVTNPVTMTRPEPVTQASKPRNVCETPGCVTLADQLLNFQDPSVDPCQDFYKAACGKYSEHEVANRRLQKKDIIIQRMIKNFLLKNETSESKSENVMRQVYRTCEGLKNEEIFNANMKTAFRELFKDIQKIGSWPAADKNWDETKLNLNEMLLNIVKLGSSNFGLFQIRPTEVPFLEVAPDMARSPKVSANFQQIIFDILEKNGLQPDENVIADDVEDYITLEETLSQYAYDYNAEKVQFSKLQAQVPSLKLEKIIEEMMNPNRKKLLVTKVKPRMVAHKHSLFFDEKMNLEKLLKSTPKRTLANYLIFYYMDHAMNGLSVHDNVIKKRNCEKLVIEYLPKASLRVFVRNHFEKGNLKIVDEMAEETKKSFIEMLQESTWLGADSKKNAILKLEKMGKMIGYPKEFEKKGALDKMFETLKLLPKDTLYGILKKIGRFHMEQGIEFVALETPMDPVLPVLMTNAFYTDRNHLSFLVGYMDDPLFDATYPKYVNIALTGNILAHETSHGFDTAGIKRDENGEVRSWMKPEDLKEYGKKTQCLVDQYNEYDDPVFGKNLNGTTTLNEMVADMIGVTVAWKVFEKLDSSKEQKVIGFENENIDKLYFRAAALDFCSLPPTTSLVEELTRVHPTGNFRVNGIFSNMPQFATAFNCPEGSPMNPKTRCSIF